MGDMLKSVYDPTAVNDDAFARANHTGTQPVSTINASAIGDGNIPVVNASNEMVASAIAETADEVVLDKSIRTPGGSVMVGQVLRLSDAAGRALFENMRTNTLQSVVCRTFDASGSNRASVESLTGRTTLELFSGDATAHTGQTLAFDFTPTITGLADQVIFRGGSGRAYLKIYAGTDNTGLLLYRSHQDYQLGASGGMLITTGTNTLDTGQLVSFESGVTYHIEILSADGNDFTLNGGVSDGSGGFTNGQNVPYFEIRYWPVTVENLPVDDEARDLAGAVISGGTHTGITPTYNVGPKTLDLALENAGVKTAYEANANTNAFTDALLTRLNSLTDAFVGATSPSNDTIRFTRQDGTTLDVQLGGGTPLFDPPVITQFEIDGQSTSVSAGTLLTGSQTFNYAVTNPGNVSGNLTLRQAGTALSTSVDPTLTSVVLTITDVTLNAGESVTFRLEGVDTQAGNFSRDFIVRAPAAHEFLYWGLSSSNNPASIDTATMQSEEIGSAPGQQISISTGTTTAGQYFIVLAPADDDISTIFDTVLDQDVTDIFTKTVNVRQISGNNYNSYVLGPLNAGGDETYNVTLT